MSFRASAPLDLRMDPSRGESAAVRVARANEDELAVVLREHADLGPSRRLARALITAAQSGQLETTADLAQLTARHLGSHPRERARVFQALRTWVNDEAGELDAMLEWLPGALRPGGVVVTLAYHSGEDRRIKHALRGRPAPPPRRLPPTVAAPPQGPWEELTRKVVVPSPEEVAANPRARSARLRAFRRRST
jgi:16S rRNA (cytosine1402-N4)-methyltransferase